MLWLVFNIKRALLDTTCALVNELSAHLKIIMSVYQGTFYCDCLSRFLAYSFFLINREPILESFILTVDDYACF